MDGVTWGGPSLLVTLPKWFIIEMPFAPYDRAILDVRFLCSNCIIIKSSACLVFSERELMFTFAICRRPSVCLSVVCLSVCNVRAPYSAD